MQSDDDGWDIYWASVMSIKQIFSPESNIRLEPQQIVNHFPNHYELTRKVSTSDGYTCSQAVNATSPAGLIH